MDKAVALTAGKRDRMRSSLFTLFVIFAGVNWCGHAPQSSRETHSAFF